MPAGASHAASPPWPVYSAELAATALLVAVGLSIVILDFGDGSPVARVVPSEGARRLITGFLFGTTGALIAVSPLGRISGAHINPVVTLAFRLVGKLRTRDAVGYVVAQLAGAILGALPLLLWGRLGRSAAFGATLPDRGHPYAAAVGGEMATTLALILGLFLFLRHRRIRRWTPLLFPFLYAVMVFLEGPLSGTSTNPARSLGPAVVSGAWRGWWIYWVGPIAGTLVAVALLRGPLLPAIEVEVAKVWHFEHDRHGVFRGPKPPPVIGRA
jgi:aquaporin Z